MSKESLNDNIIIGSNPSQPSIIVIQREFVPKKRRGYNSDFLSPQKFKYNPVIRRMRETNQISDSTTQFFNKSLHYKYNNGNGNGNGVPMHNEKYDQNRNKPSVFSKILRKSITNPDEAIEELEAYLLKKDTKKPDLRDFNLFIKNFGDGGHFKYCEKILLIMKKLSINPSLVTYSTLISRSAYWKKLSMAESYFRQMVNLDIKPDVQAYNSLINAYAKAADLNKAFEVLKEMDKAMVKPTVITFNTLMDCCARNGNFAKAKEMLNVMKERGIEPNERSYTAIVLALCQAGQANAAFQLVNKMESEGFTLSSVTYSACLHGLGTEGNLDAAFSVFQSMKQSGIKPNVVTMSSLIHACGTHGKLDLAFSIYSEMLQSKNKVELPNSITCSTLVDTCLKAGQVDKAVSVVQDMRNLNIKLTEVTYTSLITEMTRLRKLDKIIEILLGDTNSSGGNNSGMRTQSPITSEILKRSSLFPLSAKTIGSTNVNVLARDSRDASSSGHKHIKDDVDSTIPNNNLDLDITSNSSNDEFFDGTEIGAMSPGEIVDYDAAVSNYEKMKMQGVARSEDVYKNLMKTMYEDSMRRSRDSPYSSKSKQMRHDELFRLYLVFQEMRAEGVQPDTAAYNTLINACAGVGDLERALESIQAMQLDGIAPDVITYTSLIKACGINGGVGTVTMAEDIFEAMQQRTNHFSSYIEPTELTFQRLMQVHLRATNAGSNIVNINNNNNNVGLGGIHSVKDNAGISNNVGGRNVNTGRILALMNDLVKRGLKPGLSICRTCIRAACHDGDVEMAQAMLRIIKTTTRVKYDYVSWELVATLCKSKRLYKEEEILKCEIEAERIKAVPKKM